MKKSLFQLSTPKKYFNTAFNGQPKDPNKNMAPLYIGGGIDTPTPPTPTPGIFTSPFNSIFS